MRSAPTPRGHYVYFHRRATDFSVFYVGKGSDRRAWATTGRSAWWKRTKQKHGVIVEIHKSGLDEKAALELEVEIISLLRPTNILVNLVNGGGGTTGWKHSQETKDKISAFNKGKKISQEALDALIRYNTGKKLTDEHKLKLSLAKKGKPGHAMSTETRKKISQSHMGMRPSPETLKKLSESKIGKAVGKLSHSYDHKIRKFSHPQLGVFEGTRGDFILEYGIADGCLSSMINGKRRTVNKWRLL